MTTHQVNYDLKQSGSPRVSIVGLILLMIGGPSFAAFQKPSVGMPTSPNFMRYAMVVGLAGAIAGILEISIF